MENYILYQYALSPTTDEARATAGTEAQNARLAQLLTERHGLHNGLSLTEIKEERDGTQTMAKFFNELLHCNGGVAVLRVRNNKQKTVIPITGLEEQKVDHHPYCNVVIDTRSHILLVQRKASAFSDTDHVARLVTESCARELELPQQGWRIDLQKRYMCGSIWELVHSRIELGDEIKKMTIICDEKRAMSGSDPLSKAFQLLMSSLNTPDVELTCFQRDEDDRRLFDDTREHVREAVNLMVAHHYRLRVYFKRPGCIEFGTQAEASYGIEDGCVEGFGYQFHDWLDNTVSNDAGCEYGPLRTKKDGRRNGRGKKQSA